MPYLANAAQILIEFVFGIVVGLVVLRVLLQLVRANFHNPICQFLYKATNPVLMPLRRIIPAWRRLDVAGVVLAWLLLLLKRVLIFAVLGPLPSAGGLALIAFADLIGFTLMMLLVLIIARVILSFAGSDSRHPVVPLIHQLTEPVLRPVRTRMPAPGGLDFSPMIVLLSIALLQALLVAPLLDLGVRLGMAS
ncbi:MAG TPA: YggT family protein [Dokdonella sp.]|uniref:YggT family protein n=1 Tax=Dokdonella sp. TaxID=2291710 RepID=UPI002C843EEB|nr:YggT family protein [Dokdonella sp.]HOX72012.1 YggT family protein [Dokdonella sp.]